MAIKLRVISEQYRDLGDNRVRVFGVNGGSVGRAPDNDWVLPDPGRVVSGHHFEVQYHGGKYWLNDTSTNGVFVNQSDDPASLAGRVELRDGDRLRVGDYELLVSVDSRIDFLPAAAEEQAASRHLDSDIGHQLDLNSLLTPRDSSESGSISMRNAFGVRVSSEARASLLEALQRSVDRMDGDTSTSGSHGRPDSVVPVMRAAGQREERPASPEAPVNRTGSQPVASPDWALSTRPIPKEVLNDVLARRQNRVAERERAVPFYQQASTWTDLRSALQAFCRGAGIEPGSLTPEAQAMLPLVAGQVLREAIVGLTDLTHARANGLLGKRTTAPPSPSGSSNPLRTSTSVEHAIQRLFESHGRIYGGPVDAVRDVLQEVKDHEAAVASAVRAGLNGVLAQLSPANVADQFEQGRARTLAPGQDPRPRYWEHYADFFRLLTQSTGSDELPHPFVEEFSREYARTRAELRAKRSS